MSVSEYIAQLADGTEIVLGLCDCGHAAIFCFLCVGHPHCQHSVTPLFSGSQRLWLSLYTKLGTVMFFFFLRQNRGTVLLRGILSGIRLRHKEIVYGVRL